MDRGYPATAITHDRAARAWRLDAGFDTVDGMWRIVDAGATARVLDAGGGCVYEGVISADLPVLLSCGEQELRLEPLEIDGHTVLYLASAPMQPGQSYLEQPLKLTGGRHPAPEELANLPAFGAGTMIATDQGEMPVDWLRPGDMILTRDNGYQPLLWLGQHMMPRRAASDARPRRVRFDQFGAGQPARDLVATPGTGLLLAGPELDLWFGESEMLARFDTLPNCDDRADGAQPLYSLVFDQPDIILAEGLWVSTVHVDPDFISLLPDGVRGVLGPRLAAPHTQPARAWMAAWEVGMLARERKARRARLAA
ncbi:Hint domain-containing protein [Pseudothioclava nitratireducens]|uniref:Hint domain-containing protein n=1 Tax=Pseudothioclava nitratireducens TaxID=1928646 RepID=UPI0023DB219D|nr:Hint domain-containing protein [Defluviimonas nitratireducens]MDF1619150.1 Hint domain-containing protein [Defluviimonas nitratireducens]